ncbi:MAG: DNA-binding protein [Candidatus Thalassarchaeaceae archaeon]|jgi:programmed cell death protein 5|nr:DNA-binding protein [Candidatus Thalassarchaeaceae archaeon]
MSTDDELNRIREARRAEIQKQVEAQTNQQFEMESQQAAAAQEESDLSAAMRTILTPEARERLARVEIARPDVAITVKRHLSTLHGNGQIVPPIDDATLKRILKGLDDNSRRETTIRRI